MVVNSGFESVNSKSLPVGSAGYLRNDGPLETPLHETPLYEARQNRNDSVIVGELSDHGPLTVSQRPEPKPQRLVWPDVAKGIGIVLVVAGHAIGGLIDSSISLAGLPLREVFLAIYLFHMPLFFLLSGLFISQRINANPAAFRWSIFRNLYYPYLLWSFVQFNIIYAIGSWANTPPTSYIDTIIKIPLVPVSQFWFLLVLCAMHLVTLLTLPRIGAVGVLLAGIILQSLTGVVKLDGMLLQGLFGFYVFYAIGVALTPQGVEQVLRANSPIRTIAGSILAIEVLVMTVIITMDHTTATAFYRESPRLPAATIASSAWSHAGTAAALAMTAMVITWSIRARGPIKAVLLYFGKASMPIYILHVLFVAGTRIVLVKLLGIDNVLIVLPLLLTTGIGGPLIANAILVRVRLARPLGLA